MGAVVHMPRTPCAPSGLASGAGLLRATPRPHRRAPGPQRAVAPVARLYADEDISPRVVGDLRGRNHDVWSTVERGRARATDGDQLPDASQHTNPPDTQSG